MAVFQVSFFSNALHRITDMTAILPVEKLDPPPPGFEARPEEPLRVIILLHGFSGSHSDWLRGSRVEQLALKHNVAFFCPSGENSFYLDDIWRDALYEKLVCEELPDFARRVFPVSSKREDTTIGGLSMGGYGAMRNGLKNHDVFGNILAFSSAFITDKLMQGAERDNNPIASPGYYDHVFGKPDTIKNSDRDIKYLAEKMLQDGTEVPNIYMACGSEDFLIEENTDFSNHLKKLAVKHEFHVSPGMHNWAFWDEYIEKALQWLDDKRGA